MPYDGNGTFTRLMNWVQDAASAIKIKADRHDQNDDDIAAGLSNALTKDGQTQPTANIPMNGKKLVNLGDPTTDQDATTKKYVDARKSFSTSLEIAGADANGRVNFTSPSGVNGLSFTGADFAWLAKLADAAATPPTKNRLVLNDKPDGSGADVITANDDGTLVAANVTVSKAAAEVSIKPLSGSGFVKFYGADGTERATMAIDSGAQGDLAITIGGKTVTLTKDGNIKATDTVWAGTSFLKADGNIGADAGKTTVWSPWGNAEAFAAINARIEARGQAWADNRVSSLQYRKVSQGYSGTATNWTAPAGAVVNGYQREAGNTGQVYGLYYVYLQIYDPVRGWVNFQG